MPDFIIIRVHFPHSIIQYLRFAIKFHFYHHYVSQLQSQGVDIETIMAMTGHTKLQTTERYLHVQSETKDNAVAQLNVLFAS